MIYFKGKSGDLCQLTPHTIAKISEYCKKWIDLDGEQNTIATNVFERIQRWSMQSETEQSPDEVALEIANAHYHKECYVRFRDKTKIERAEKNEKNDKERDSGS